MHRPSSTRFPSRQIITAIVLGWLLFNFPSSIFAQTEDEPADSVAVFNRAQDLHEKGDLAAAIELYKKALEIEPNFPEAEYQCGVAYLALGQNALAERSFRKAVELRAEWTLAITALGSLLVQSGQFAEADRILTKALELEPQNSLALSALTDLRLKTKASSAVLTDLLGKVTYLTSKANPTASIWSARAALEIALGKNKDARSSIASALRSDPKNRNALFQMADLALEDGDVVKAKEAARLIETVSPHSESLKMLNTKILLAGGNSDGTFRADLEKQLETDATNPVILGRLCSAYRISHPTKALEFCRRASEAEPTNANYAVGFGAALVQAKQFDAAVNVLRKIIEIAPENATAHANLATALFESKRFREAKAEYTWLTTKQPNLAAAYFFLAITHDRLEEYADAAANYQHYVRIADPVANKLDIEKVNLRLPTVLKKIKK
ncbi:MAG: tetratricopeptide repeat protein [Chloracidobacterium sp.]|nr:tetratricopeptide repeat protein [Chloracidobacterium sp.]